jgi:dUTP pyrophosphatase
MSNDLSSLPSLESPTSVSLSTFLNVRVFNKSKFPLPAYKHKDDSGMDVQANIDVPQVIDPDRSATIGTGLYFAIPPGFEFQVRSRSGLAHKVQIAVLNSPGTIDAPYRGELGIILYNHGTSPFVVNPGDRIAQLVLCPVFSCVWSPVASVEDLDTSTRAGGGFGSTGGFEDPDAYGTTAMTLTTSFDKALYEAREIKSV